MSYLTLPNGIPDFDKAVISFWFRVPRASMQTVAEKANAEYAKAGNNPYYVYPRFLGILPLVTFGADATGIQVKNVPDPYVPMHGYEAIFNGCAGWHITDAGIVGQNSPSSTYQEVGPILIDPSYIGLWVTLDQNTGELSATFRVNLQMKNGGSGAWLNTLSRTTTSDQWRSFGFSDPVGGCFPDTDTAYQYMGAPPAWYCWNDAFYPGSYWRVTISYDDVTSDWIRYDGPDKFQTGSGDDLVVAPDQWHHVLLSFDISHSSTGVGAMFGSTLPDCGSPGPVGPSLPYVVLSSGTPSITDPSKMWLALDDKNITGTSISGVNNDYPRPGILGPNDIVPQKVWDASVNTGSFFSHEKAWTTSFTIRILEREATGTPTYTSPAQKVPSNGHPFGIPCTSDHADQIHKVEMAEFQMWTGVTLDTGIVNNRRLFISSKGRPVDPALFTTMLMPPIGDPTTWEPGADIRSAPPDVNSNSAISPKQLGKPIISFTRSDQNWIKGHNLGTLKGKVTRTGKIKSYRPDPQLGK